MCLKDTKDLLSNEPLLWLESLELGNVSRLDTDESLLPSQLMTSQSRQLKRTHPLSSRSTIFEPEASWGFQMVQLSRQRCPRTGWTNDLLLKALEVDVDSGTISVVELQVVVWQLGKDTAVQPRPLDLLNSEPSY
jgi:hypothetical protein